MNPVFFHINFFKENFIISNYHIKPKIGIIELSIIIIVSVVNFALSYHISYQISYQNLKF